MKDQMIQAILHEIELRHSYLPDQRLKSIYLGGGTPSLLDQDDLSKIFDKIGRYYKWSDDCEITLEANPDDLDNQKITSFINVGVNRLSIGIQSFHNDDLQSMNRAHNAREARQCIKLAQDIGIEDITIDLIYGGNTTTDKMWEENIKTAIDLNIPHISSYALTVEENTALHHMIKNGKTPPLDDAKASRQFDLLIDAMSQDGYIHYEISNFAKPGKFAVHNSNYWKGQPYLGLGPSAHSFDGKATRSWNIAHNIEYIKSYTQNRLPLEEELLSMTDRYNEMILIRLRTIWGVDLVEISEKFPSYYDGLITKSSKQIKDGMLKKENHKLLLTTRGKHFADRISMELFSDI